MRIHFPVLLLLINSLHAGSMFERKTKLRNNAKSYYSLAEMAEEGDTIIPKTFQKFKEQ